MARAIYISRDEAEWLVDLLEDCDRDTCGSWRFDLALEIKKTFGMHIPPDEEDRS